MRISTVAITAVPFALLLALLATIVITPRLHAASASPAHQSTASAHVTELPAIVVTPSTTASTGLAVANGGFDAMVEQQSRNTCNWLFSELSMPYFSFAQPLSRNTGI